MGKSSNPASRPRTRDLLRDRVTRAITGHSAGDGSDEKEMRAPMPLMRAVSLRTRVTILSATVVLVSVSLMAAAAYFVVYRAMYNDVDQQLESRADGMAALARAGCCARSPNNWWRARCSPPTSRSRW